MAEPLRVVVVGGGVGGMAAALRLRAAGHEVTLLERNQALGGKLAGRRRDGFSFDTGPSLLTLPEVFAQLAAVAGRRLGDLVELVRLDPLCRYRFADGSGLDARAEPAAMLAEVERFSPGSGPAWTAFQARAARIWAAAEPTFFAGALDLAGMARRAKGPGALAAIDPLPTLAGRARRSFADQRLAQYAMRFATYSGSSPYLAPATLACISWIEQRYGAWYVRGGLAALGEALAGLLAATGVEVRTGVEVGAVSADAATVTGVDLADGGHLPADAVVANVDAAHLYRDLLPDRRAAAKVARAGRSSSGFVVLAGVRGRTEGLAHHNVWFSADYRAEQADIFERDQAPADPTVYACCSAVTDPSQAPDGHENWFLLVNVPSGRTERWAERADGYRDHVLEVLARRGADLSGRLAFTETITPAEIEARWRADAGAIYGTGSNSRRAAFMRPANRGPRRGLYLAGGSAHPGGGLPLVAMSGAIAAGLVAEDLAAGRLGRGRAVAS
jgi:phytoene desaturase